MAMTKRDFEAIAQILRNHAPDTGVAYDFANWLETENPRFDRERFLTACGVNQ